MSKTMIGPMRKYPRIEIDQKAYDGLQIEAVLRHKTTREIATEAILSHISTKAKSVLDHRTIGPQDPKTTMEGSHKTTMPEDIATKRPQDHRTTEGAVIDSINPQRKKRLADNPDALARIKEMWNSGQKNQAEISRQIGYHRATVNDNIQRMLESGEITK